MHECSLLGVLLLALGATPVRSQALLDSARARLPRLSGRVAVVGLDSAVEVRRDRWGVPHIYARTVSDLFFAQGYVAAQDRLWQMEMWRRQGEGRLAEVLGPGFVERDRFARLLKYRGDPRAEWTSYAPDTRDIVRAFVRGVNAYVRDVRSRPPIEFTLLGFQPEPWADEVPLQRLAALAMTGNALSEVDRARLVTVLGRERAEALFPLEPRRALDPAPGVDLATISSASLGAAAEAYGGVEYPRIEGSNNWVVSGALTATGKPLLANDPHRAVTVPSLRYLSHLVGPGWNVIGAGEPAVPGVAGGHNERIAFGFTIVGMDQQDVYVERVAPCDSALGARPSALGAAGRCYRHNDRWEPVAAIVDTIPVQGEAPRIVRLEFTHHGPIVAEDSAGGRAYVIRFVGSEPGTAGYLAQLSLDRARDWPSFLAAAYRWRLPTENLIYADVDGNIGWIAAGLNPIRDWSGTLPVPGDGRFEWRGFLPFSELPQVLNPARGFIATANHNILPDGYRHPLSYQWAAPFRANRVIQVLSGRRDWTREDFERLQHDDHSLPAAALVPVLLGAAGRRGVGGSAMDLLRSWDYRMSRDAPQPVIFAAWLREVGARVSGRLLGGAGRELRGRTLDLSLVGELLRAPDTRLGPSPAAARDSLALGAFDAALATVTRELGGSPTTWRWGAIHVAPFRHPLASAFDLPSMGRGGDGNTVNMTGGRGWLQTAGASYRGIFDLADWDNSVATSVPGQSGQPGSEFYGNLLPLWGEGRYFPLVYSRAAVERETKHVLWLEPR
jgi:penicillin amidase